MISGRDWKAALLRVGIRTYSPTCEHDPIAARKKLASRWELGLRFHLAAGSIGIVQKSVRAFWDNPNVPSGHWNCAEERMRLLGQLQ